MVCCRQGSVCNDQVTGQNDPLAVDSMLSFRAQIDAICSNHGTSESDQFQKRARYVLLRRGGDLYTAECHLQCRWHLHGEHGGNV
jgi:hypothetical protein